jgi:alanine racemase
MIKARPARIEISADALVHNLHRVKDCAPGKKIMAMVKANAYGCGLPRVTSALHDYVDMFGVSCFEEATAIRASGVTKDCVLCEGIFSPDELSGVVAQNFQLVVHHQLQLEWLLAKPLAKKIKVWIKVNTGMNRIGFASDEVNTVFRALVDCPWVDSEIGIMTHLASADHPTDPHNRLQEKLFNQLALPDVQMPRSMVNSAGIFAFPEMHFDIVRPGIMLYGISPFPEQVGHELGLVPVMRFNSAIIAIHHYPPFTPVGYAGIWQSDKPSIIGVVAAGYGDGYPRHIIPNAPVWTNNRIVPIVGLISMDMMTIDLTECPNARIGDRVELWGEHVPVEIIAKHAETNAYELICKITERVR